MYDNEINKILNQQQGSKKYDLDIKHAINYSDEIEKQNANQWLDFNGFIWVAVDGIFLNCKNDIQSQVILSQT